VGVINALTVDFEDWYHVLYYESVVDRNRWDRFEERIELCAGRTLDLLERTGVRATFFVLGWLAERRPELIRRIAKSGHEIASHSHAHRLVHTLTRAEFVTDLRRSLEVLEDCAGRPIRGYRAPSFSVTEATPWVFEELLAAGLDYDSSVQPMRRYYGGMSDTPRYPYRVPIAGGGSIREFPVSTVRAFGRNLCFSGGGYLRLLPGTMVRRIIRRRNREGQPVVIYFHPWELDPDPSKLKMSWRQRWDGRFASEIGRKGMEEKLESILREVTLAPMADVLDHVLPSRRTS